MKKTTIFGWAAGLMMATAFTAQAADPTYILDPADGAVVDEFETVTLTFPDAEVGFYESETTPALFLKLENYEGVEFVCYEPVKNEVEKGTSYTFNLVSDWYTPYSRPGTYSIVISNMYQVVDGQKVNISNINSTFEIYAPITYEYEFSQSQTDATNLQNLQMTVFGQTLGFVENSQIPVALLIGGGKEYECKKPDVVNENGNTFITFKWQVADDPEEAAPTRISTPGNYVLYLKNYWIDELYNAQQPTAFTFTINATGNEFKYIPKGDKVQPETPNVTQLGFLKVDYHTSLELVNPGKIDDLGNILSKTPVTVTVPGASAPFNLYPYLDIPGDNSGIGGLEAGVMPLAIGDNRLVVDFAELNAALEYILPVGKYTVIIPENIVKDAAGAVNPEQQFTINRYKSGDPGTPNLPGVDESDPNWPLIEYKAEDLEDLTLDWFTEEIQLSGVGQIYVQKEKGGMPIPLVEQRDIWFDDFKLHIDLSDLEPGIWNVFIPEGYFIIDLEWLNTEQILTYKIVGEDSSDEPTGLMSEAVVLSPAGAFQTSLGLIDLSYENGVKLELVSPSTEENDAEFFYSTIPAIVEFENAEGSYEVYPYVMTMLAGGNADFMPYDDDEDDMETEDILTINVDALAEQFNWLLPKGKCTITIPEGIVKNEIGNVNPLQTLEFTLCFSADPGVVTPLELNEETWEAYEYEASELSDVTVVWEEYSEIVETGSGEITLNVNDWFATADPTPLTDMIKVDGNTLHIDLSRVEEGNWTVNIPEGYFLLNENTINCEQGINYTILAGDTNGVVAIEADANGMYVAYDLNGVKVLTTADSAALRTLAKGIYVVNGRKVLVK